MDSTPKTERLSTRPLDDYVREQAHLGALKRYLTGPAMDAPATASQE
jgi:hypothetical protein